MFKDRVERERLAHTDDDVLSESYRLKDRFPHIWTFPSRKRLFDVIDAYLMDLSGKRILDYGCGRGETARRYFSLGAFVDGIDISEVYISQARQLVAREGIDTSRCQFQVMDAHQLAFGANTFDLVVGNGILHHLDAKVALNEIYRVLKPGGRVLLQEPLADNPLLKIFRMLTPKARTVDERPFSGKDIKHLAGLNAWAINMSYCGLIEAPVAMITSIVMPNYPQNVILDFADKLEKWTHDNNILLSWNQYILFNMVKR